MNLQYIVLESTVNILKSGKNFYYFDSIKLLKCSRSPQYNNLAKHSNGRKSK